MAAGSPIEFVDGAAPSGLSFSFVDLASGTDDVVFLNGSDAPIVPTPADGYDPAVRAVVVSLNGTFNTATATAQPSFTLAYRVRLQ